MTGIDIEIWHSGPRALVAKGEVRKWISFYFKVYLLNSFVFIGAFFLVVYFDSK